MKKGTSILLSVLIILSMANLSFAVHYCGGQVAARKISFSAEKASCGMHVKHTENTHDKAFVSGMCEDHVSIYSIERNYVPSVNKVTPDSISGLAIIDLTSLNYFDTAIQSKYTSLNTGPPLAIYPGTVDLTEICILRI